jgi:hypothetical protein
MLDRSPIQSALSSDWTKQEYIYLPLTKTVDKQEGKKK